MSTLNYIDENGNINKAGIIPSNYLRKIDELYSAVFRGSVSVTADGVKTYGQLLNELYSNPKWNISKVTKESSFAIGGNIFMPLYNDGSVASFSKQNIENNAVVEYVVMIGSITSYFSNVQDITSDIVDDGTVITLYY